MKVLETVIARAWVLLFLIGTLFILLAYYRFSGKVTNPAITAGQLEVPLLLLGIVLLVGASVSYLVEKDVSWLPSRDRVMMRPDGVAASYGNATLYVRFGKLEDKAAACSDRCAVVLPINNYFEERCFDDCRIALGSYLATNFSPSDVGSIRAAVDSELVRQYPGVARPFPIGTAVHVKYDGHHMIMPAASTKQTPQGVKSEISFLYSAMHGIIERIVEEEIEILYLPLMGAGKGGIPDQVALLSLLISICESVNRASGHHLREAHIVIFEGPRQKVFPADARRIMRMCLALWSQTSRA
jgi:hypothetical protein